MQCEDCGLITRTFVVSRQTCPGFSGPIASDPAFRCPQGNECLDVWITRGVCEWCNDIEPSDPSDEEVSDEDASDEEALDEADSSDDDSGEDSAESESV